MNFTKSTTKGQETEIRFWRDNQRTYYKDTFSKMETSGRKHPFYFAAAFSIARWRYREPHLVGYTMWLHDDRVMTPYKTPYVVWGLGRGDGLVVESMSRNPEGRGSIPRLGSRRSSLISIEHAELLRSTPSLVLCCAWLVTMALHDNACALRLGPTQPVTDFWGWQMSSS